MNWLTLSNGTVADLARLIPLLKQLPALPPAERNKLLAKLQPLFGASLPEPLRLLACPLEALGGDDCKGVTPSLAWSPEGLKDLAATQTRGALQLRLAGGTTQQLRFEAVATPPAEITPPSGQWPTRLALEGGFTASAGLELPIRLGGLAADASSAGSLALECWFHHSPDQLFGAALAAGLASITAPFDLENLATALGGQGALLALAFTAQGSLGYGGSLALGKSFDLGKGVAASAGLRYAYRAERQGQYRFLATANPDGRVRLEIGRERRSQSEEQARLGVEIDFSPLFQELKPLLEQQLGEASGLLAQLQGFFPPSAVLHNELLQRSQVLAGDTELGQWLPVLLGPGGADPLAERLRQRIGALIDQGSGVWSGAGQTLGDRVVAQLLQRLPPDVPVSIRAKFETRLRDLATSSLATLDQRLRDRLTAISNTGLDQLTEQLEKLGVKALPDRLAQVEERVDGLAAPIRAQLDQIQELLVRISAAIQKAAEARLSLGWWREERRSAGRTLDAVLLFDPQVPTAAERFREAITGSLEDIFALAAHPGSGVTLESGTLRRQAGIDTTSGFEMVFMDFALKSQSIFSANVEIVADPAGNVRVFTRGDSGWLLQLWHERDSAHLVNLFELASAQETRQASLQMNVAHEEEALTEREIAQFFGALEDTGLLPAGIGARAFLQLCDAKPAAGSAALKIALDLDDARLNRLLGAGGGGLDGEFVFRTAVEALVEANDLVGSKVAAANLRHRIKTEKMGKDMQEVIANLRKPSYRDPWSARFDISADPVGYNDFQTLESFCAQALGLHQVLGLLGEIYLSPPAWDEQGYLDRQQAIDREVGRWLRGDLWSRWIKPLLDDEVRPGVLALLLALHRLAAAEGSPPPLRAVLWLLEGTEVREIELA